MHRRGGKRIRMDDPPPEYVNPMTPATPMTDYGGQSVHEPDTPATPNYSGFNVGAIANSTGVLLEPPRDEAEESRHSEPPHVEEEEPRSPSPAPTKRVTRSRGRRGDGAFPGRLAESPPPAPLRKRGRGAGRARGRGRGAAVPPSYSPPPVLLPGDDENSLYNILRFNKSSINTVVDTWIEEYKTHRDVALVQLMQFFINSSGCRGKVTPDMAQMDHTLIIKKMTQEFDEESGEYPLIMSGQTWKKFRATFCEFIQTLVKMCQYSIIYDQFLMDNIISLLTGLSDSQVRAFRHTATLAVMKLMTALVDVALLTSINCDNCLRQYEAERLKARDKRASERLEVLVAKRQELEENMEEIKNMLSYMFKSVFVHRYRDTLPEIRSITMTEIGSWMEKFPAHFLDDLYLKYIGWTLHDKVGEVRLRCLQALTPLYSCDDLRGKLELFTSKFKDRIVSMSLDKETDVAVHAVKLVIAILKMHPDVLTDKDCENVYELVYSSWRGVAAAAGEFLNVRLFQPPAAPPPALRSRRGKLRLPNTSLVRDLVQFFIESELHEHGAYLVDSLIESNPMMKDWECMTDLLLEEAGPGEEALDNRQESSLIELMVCCVRQASTGEPPVGRGPLRKHHSALSKEQAKIQAKAVSDDRAKMTTHFMATLPALLEKFGADPEKLTNLVSIPQHMDLELYTTQRQEANLTLLLNKIRDIVSIQTEAEVVETCGRTLEALCGEQCGVYTRCNVARATITDMCVNRYKEAIDEYRTLIEGGETPDADEVFNVVNSLRKVSIMYMCHNLNDTNIWDSLFDDLPKCLAQNESQMPTQALVYVVRACFYSVVWSLHALEERVASGGGAPAVAEEAAALRARLHAYCAVCRSIVDEGASPDLKEEAYTSLCDLLIVFAEQLVLTGGGGGAVLRSLVYEPDAALADMLNRFIQEFVFVHHNYDGQDERRIEELHKRRNFLAAYCKLIVYNVAPIRRAADVFKHYIKCYNDYGDIIKATLSKAREINKLNCALTMQLAMQALFQDIAHAHRAVHRQLTEFTELKELAKRFSVMFGLDAVKNREALTALHRAGIAFAALELAPPAPPPNLLFLEPLTEFSGKLLRQDKRQVLKFLDARIVHSVSWGDEWAPFMQYRNSLLTDAPDERPPPAARRHYTRRNRGQTEEEEGDDNAESDQEAPGSRRRVRLSVCHRRTSLPRWRRASPSPPPARSPSIHTSSQSPLPSRQSSRPKTPTSPSLNRSSPTEESSGSPSEKSERLKTPCKNSHTEEPTKQCKVGIINKANKQRLGSSANTSSPTEKFTTSLLKFGILCSSKSKRQEHTPSPETKKPSPSRGSKEPSLSPESKEPSPSPESKEPRPSPDSKEPSMSPDSMEPSLSPDIKEPSLSRHSKQPRPSKNKQQSNKQRLGSSANTSSSAEKFTTSRLKVGILCSSKSKRQEHTPSPETKKPSPSRDSKEPSLSPESKEPSPSPGSKEPSMSPDSKEPSLSLDIKEPSLSRYSKQPRPSNNKNKQRLGSSANMSSSAEKFTTSQLKVGILCSSKSKRQEHTPSPETKKQSPSRDSKEPSLSPESKEPSLSPDIKEPSLSRHSKQPRPSNNKNKQQSNKQRLGLSANKSSLLEKFTTSRLKVGILCSSKYKRQEHTPLPETKKPSPSRDSKEPSLSPDSKEPSLSPDGKEPSLSPDSKEPSLSPDGKEPSLSPDSKEPSLSPDGKEPSPSKDGKEPSHSPDSKEPSMSPDSRKRKSPSTPMNVKERSVRKRLRMSRSPESNLVTRQPKAARASETAAYLEELHAGTQSSAGSLRSAAGGARRLSVTAEVHAAPRYMSVGSDTSSTSK